LALVAGLAAGTVALWRRVGPAVLAADDYRLDVGDVDITPPPPWIVTDVRAEALRVASLDDRPSIGQPDLLERIAAAFRLHPWVAEVTRVARSYPARVRVDVVYRRPVCMVELPSGGLFPVDGQGVLLPSADFLSPTAQRAARSYPRLAAIDTHPRGGVGGPWGDPRVEGGAAIAAALLEAWGELRLARIVPSSEPDPRDAHVYELETRGGARIIWGQAAGGEQSGEPSAEAKVSRLREHVAALGPLTPQNLPRGLDLRRPAAGDVPAAEDGPAHGRAARRGP
jgi:hypothetical protein